MSVLYYDAWSSRPDGRELDLVGAFLERLGHRLVDVFRLIVVDGSVWVWEYERDADDKKYLISEDEAATTLSWHRRVA